MSSSLRVCSQHASINSTQIIFSSRGKGSLLQPCMGVGLLYYYLCSIGIEVII